MTQPDSLASDAASAGPSTGTDLDRLVSLASGFPLPVFRQNYRQLRGKINVQARSLWLAGGPTLPTAKKIATVVTGGQQLVSHMSQLYVRNNLGAKFTPFNPGPGITERPDVDKIEEYLRPAREVDTGAQLRRLGTLINTDLQLTKVRTFYSAFDEDINQNRKSIQLYRRVVGGENPCALCEIAAEQVYFTDDLLPIHDNCECDIEEDDGTRITDEMASKHHIGFVERVLATGDQKKTFESLADEDAPPEAYHNMVKVEQHGELGPVITWRHQKFTGPGDLPNPTQPRPAPTLNTGDRHEERVRSNAARVAQYRAQHNLSPDMTPPAKPEAAKPKRRKPIQVGSMGHVNVTVGADGQIHIEDMKDVAPNELPPVELDKPDKFDWEREGQDGFWTTADLKDGVEYMRQKFGDRMGLDPFSRQDGWTSERYPVEAQRRTLQAIDEIWSKYPDAHISQFKMDDLGKNTVAQTLARIDVPGDTEYIAFNKDVMRRLPGEMKEAFKQSEGNGFYFDGAAKDPYRAMVYHEFAHALDNRGTWHARASMTKDMQKLFFNSPEGKQLLAYADGTTGSAPESEIKRLFGKWLSERGRVSGYSMESGVVPGQPDPWTGIISKDIIPNPAEAIAQAFDDVERRGDAASDLSKELHRRVIEEARKPVGDDWIYGSRSSLKQNATQRLSGLREIKTAWSDADYAKEDNVSLTDVQRSEALSEAKALLQKSLQVEPAITAAARAAVEKQGGYMSGLDFRIKTGPSLYRKIQAEMIEKQVSASVAAGGIKDAVRYTGVFDPEGFWASSDQLRDALTGIGAQIVKDPVGVPLYGYRGRNMAFKLHGVDFEMQTNTDLGIAIKDECHQIYNVSRKLDVDPARPNLAEAAEKRRLEDEMQQKWDTIPITKGTPVVQTEKDAKSGDPSKVLYIAKSTRYRGPTVPGGESKLGSPEMVKRERVPTVHYGMNWLPESGNEKIVERARAVSDDAWNTLPVQQLPWGTTIEANEGTLKKSSIDKVTSGKEPFREGYVIKLWRDDKNRLHVVDGHTRIAMYNVLNKDMPVRIMDEHSYQQIQESTANPTVEKRLSDMIDRPMNANPLDDMEARKQFTRYGPGGKFDSPYPLNPDDVTAKGVDFLNHDHMVANILARYHDCVGDKAWMLDAGHDWYPSARLWILKMLDKTGHADMPIDKAAAIVGSYSENASWASNMVRALNYFSGKPSGAFKATDARVAKIAASDDPLSEVRGPKVNNFVRAILGFDRFPDAVAVDRWAARIALGTDDKELASKILGRTVSGKHAGYEAMADAYRDAAKQLGIPPSELQSVTWIHAVPADETANTFKEKREWDFS